MQDRLGLHRSFGLRLPATTPAADFCRSLDIDRSIPSPHQLARTERQISRGKFDCFQHTTGGSTLAAPLMDQHFVVEGPLVPAAAGLISASCSSARAFAPRFFQTRPRGRGPCASLPFTSIWLVEDFHLKAVKHARHTFSRLRRGTLAPDLCRPRAPADGAARSPQLSSFESSARQARRN
jgi:hypothetical protein